MTGPNELRRSLGFTDLMLITIGTVIGSGIYLVPSVVLRQTGGHTGLAFAVWAVAGFLSLLGALTYAELGAMKPEAGGLYAYLRDAFGPLPAFLYGWASFLVIASGSIAALAVAFANYLSPLLPFHVPGPVISVAVIVVVALINIRGTRGSATVQNWTTGAKFGVLFLLSLVLTLRGNGGAGLPTTPIAVPNGSLAAGFGAAMIGVLWAYEGLAVRDVLGRRGEGPAAHVPARDQHRDVPAHRAVPDGKPRLRAGARCRRARRTASASPPTRSARSSARLPVRW